MKKNFIKKKLKNLSLLRTKKIVGDISLDIELVSNASLFIFDDFGLLVGAWWKTTIRKVSSASSRRFSGIVQHHRSRVQILHYPTRYVSAPARACVRQILSFLIVCFVHKSLFDYAARRSRERERERGRKNNRRAVC